MECGHGTIESRVQRHGTLDIVVEARDTRYPAMATEMQDVGDQVFAAERAQVQVIEMEWVRSHRGDQT